MDTLQQALVNEVKRFASANYEMDGWDYIVECFSDDEILEAIGSAKTAKSAIRAVGQTAKVLADRRSEMECFEGYL